MARKAITPRSNRKGTLADFFAASPLRNSGLVVERKKDRPRVPDFETAEKGDELPPSDAEGG